ncbi:hypothetical protein RB5076 [Rhodopirellula baltica SH 1]|uniref:Uncharacterized protein n=1 Tax=Rhodopirellula baltica (strain DSM 10527 / NCIMB 13988 / SH1) TaxID=243090 RepID=Q7UGQ6_RHOBA|nr:hypothetical protein RB5076 [Rhodopirellula baltica SH 1]
MVSSACRWTYQNSDVSVGTRPNSWRIRLRCVTAFSGHRRRPGSTWRGGWPDLRELENAGEPPRFVPKHWRDARYNLAYETRGFQSEPSTRAPSEPLFGISPDVGVVEDGTRHS